MVQSSDIRLMTEKVFQDRAARQDGVLNDYVQRVQSLETLGGLAPGNVSDATMASIGANPDSQFRQGMNGSYATRVPGIVNASDARFAGGVRYGRTGSENRVALQAAIDSRKGLGGTVVISSPEPPFLPSAFLDMEAGLVLWARITLATSGKLVRLRMAPGATTSLIKVGATDGSDSNWHWGEIRDLYLDGNKANQTARPLVAVASASSAGYVATLATSQPHGITVGDVVQVAGIVPDSYNGTWRVDSVPTPTTLTYGIMTNAPAASTQGGTAQVMLDLIAIAEGGETSRLQSVYLNNSFNSGVFQGTNGTPMRYSNVSAFGCNDHGFDLWCDRPIQLDTPSGDFNGKSLVHLGGKSSAGGNGTNSSVVITNLKAEHHNVPAVWIDDFDGPLTLLGGSIDQEIGNTAPPILRTGAPNSSLHMKGVRINKRATGPIFEDRSSHAANITSDTVLTKTYVQDVASQPTGATRFTQKRNDLTEAATVVINLQNGTLCKLNGTLDRRVFGNPVNQPTGAPNGYLLVLTIKNAAAGTITTWGPLFLIGGWSDPAAGKSKTVTFWWDGSAYQLISISPEF